jgi:tetratricopeptide (TPR) repeat protein
MTDVLYERYKDALRLGHVAALRGRLDAALVAYGDAARIAPDRALPHSSMGQILQRLGRHEEALAAYATALDRAPRDEPALAGRAEVLAGLGRRVDAAEALDLLADAQELGGRIADACDSARRALELAESRPRRRHVEQLIARLREGPADEASAAALRRAIDVVGSDSPSTPVDIADAEPPVDPAALVAEAEDLADGGDRSGAHALLLRAASLHREAGRANAAFDACYLALAIAPGDPALHLLLAKLYAERGWLVPAREKLLLLGRLVDLTEDSAGRAEMCRIISQDFADDPALSALCA